MSVTQIVRTVVILDDDTVLRTNQEYRLTKPGLNLTVPICRPKEFIIIDPMFKQLSIPTKLLAPVATIDGSNADVDLIADKRTVLACASQNAWKRL